MNTADDVWLCQRQKIIVPLEIARPILKPFAPVGRFVQIVGLDHGSHGAVKYENTLFEKLFQLGCLIVDFFSIGSLGFLFMSGEGARPINGKWQTLNRPG